MKGTLVGIIGFLVAIIFAMLWWQERNETKPRLPPSFIEERLAGQRFVPVTDRVPKVVAVCPPGFLRGSYIMGWTATANYTVDLAQLGLSLSEEDPPTLRATLPPLALLNGGDNIIGAEDHFWFPRPFAAGLMRHYAAEKVRASQIAIASALHRLKTDPDITTLAETQIRGLLASILAQTDYQVAGIEVDIADYEVEVELPENPPLCKDQPLAGSTVDAAFVAMSDAQLEGAVPGEIRSFASAEREILSLSVDEWEAWMAGPTATLPVEAVVTAKPPSQP